MKFAWSMTVSLAVVVVSAGVAFADTPPRVCSASTLAGPYGYVRQGHDTGGTYVTAIGLATFDGAGSVSASEVLSTNGVFSHVAPVTNAYVVSGDCSALIVDSSGAQIRKLTIAHAGESVLGMSLVSGRTETIDYERVAERRGALDVWRDDADVEAEPGCTLATFTGTYSFQRSGHIPTGDLVAAGILLSDGEGNQSATQTTGRNGVFSDTATPILATYTVAPDCTGTDIDPTGRVFSEFVIVHGGSEVLGISETAGNNVIARYERVFRTGGGSK